MSEPDPAPALSLAAPCFNEADVIAGVIAEWDRALDALDVPSEIVVCNDGSTDRTGEVLESLRTAHPRLRVVSFARNGGYGRALAAALSATRGQYVALLDSDGQFSADEAVEMYQLASREGWDCVAGYRVKKQDSPVRVGADLGLRALVRLAFPARVRDPNCASRVMHGELARSLRVESRGFITPTELIVRACDRGARVTEFPVVHRVRAGGESKLRVARTAWDALWFLAYLRLQLRLSRRGIIVAR
jgi:glycosyltransferase involved in cell wall biosynthesis